MNWDFNILLEHQAAFKNALLVTIRISLFSILFGTAIGLFLAVANLVNDRVVRVLVRCYVELFLAVPALVLLIWLYFGLPKISRMLLMTGESAAVLGLGLSLSAFVAEILRAGFATIPRGQLEAAYCTGMSRTLAVRYILLPQVFRQSWPPLVGQFITTYKFSTLASTLAVHELLHTANTITAQIYRPLEVYTAIALIFIFTIIPCNLLLHKIEHSRQFGGVSKL